MSVNNNQNTLIIITGPTGSGKTDLAIKLAQHFGCDIISADSRQLFHDIPIGTAAPDASQLSMVKHHFIGTLDLDKYYSAACYESDVLDLLPKLWEKNNIAVMCGGSMMYVDAVTNGVDDLPTVSDHVRESVKEIYDREGLTGIRAMLRNLDPEYLSKADISNPRRLIHAIEVSIEAGVPYSSLLTGTKKKRDFRILKMMIDLPREELFARINLRVDAMIASGLIDEARKVLPMRHLNSLNTVGFKELFAYFDGNMTLEEAIARIGKNTRVYAKKQLTWLKKDPDVIRLNPSDPYADALEYLRQAGLNSSDIIR